MGEQHGIDYTTDTEGHPVVPLPVRWYLGAHGDPIAVFDHIVLHLHRDGSVTWSDQSQGDSNAD